MKIYKVKVNGKVYEVELESVTENAPQAVTPTPVVTATKGTDVIVPMAGTIIDIKVSIGQKVNQGDILFILEAMKLENEIKAPVTGTITKIFATKGQMVTNGQLIVTIG